MLGCKTCQPVLNWSLPSRLSQTCICHDALIIDIFYYPKPHLGKDALSKGLGGLNPSVASQMALGKGLGGLNPSTWRGLPPSQETNGGRKGSIGQSARHQGGTREAGKNHLDSLGGTREAGKDQLDWEAPGRQERINWTACEAPGDTREAGKSLLDSLGGAREAQGRLVAQDCRSNRGAGFCLTFNTTSMANGPVRGKSWGGLHARLPSTEMPLRGTREAGKDQLDSLRGTREARKKSIGQPARHQGGRKEPIG